MLAVSSGRVMSRAHAEQNSWSEPWLPSKSGSWADMLDEADELEPEIYQTNLTAPSMDSLGTFGSVSSNSLPHPRDCAITSSDDDCSTEAPSEDGETSAWADTTPSARAGRSSNSSWQVSGWKNYEWNDRASSSPSWKSKAYSSSSKYGEDSRSTGQNWHQQARRGAAYSSQQRNDGWKQSSKPRASRWPATDKKACPAPQVGKKPQCQFMIGIEEDRTFGVVRRVLGLHGKHVKSIAEQSGAKLRLRGVGSGFKEGPENRESKDPLMLCVSAQDNASYEIAKNLLTEHLESVYAEYREFCAENRMKGRRHVTVNLHEGPREGHF